MISMIAFMGENEQAGQRLAGSIHPRSHRSGSEGGCLMSNRFQVRGCCCGIPFGCGLLTFAAASVAVWKLAVPGLASLLALFAQ
jgi:hypothetical protein